MAYTVNTASPDLRGAAVFGFGNPRPSSGYATTTVAVMDDDSAASNGVAVNAVPDGPGSLFASLEATTAGNADTSFDLGDGATVAVNDNDTPGGVQLYFDEDAANADERFLAVSPTGQDLFIPASSGMLIRVKHDASAASNGVAVYCDEDGATAAERLLFVSPTNADGSAVTDDEVGLHEPGTGYGLTVISEPGMIDGTAKPAISAAVTPATTSGKFRGFIVSEDGDGTYTVTQTADDSHNSAGAALTAAEALDVPAGGTALFAGSVSDSAIGTVFSWAVRGKKPPVSADA